MDNNTLVELKFLIVSTFWRSVANKPFHFRENKKHLASRVFENNEKL
jgi:CYTH domain-containing protein